MMTLPDGKLKIFFLFYRSFDIMLRLFNLGAESKWNARVLNFQSPYGIHIWHYISENPDDFGRNVVPKAKRSFVLEESLNLQTFKITFGHPESSLTLKWNSKGCDQTNISPFYIKISLLMRKLFEFDMISTSRDIWATNIGLSIMSSRKEEPHRIRNRLLLQFGRKSKFQEWDPL